MFNPQRGEWKSQIFLLLSGVGHLPGFWTFGMAHCHHTCPHTSSATCQNTLPLLVCLQVLYVLCFLLPGLLTIARKKFADSDTLSYTHHIVPLRKECAGVFGSFGAQIGKGYMGRWRYVGGCWRQRIHGQMEGVEIMDILGEGDP